MYMSNINYELMKLLLMKMILHIYSEKFTTFISQPNTEYSCNRDIYDVIRHPLIIDPSK